VPPPLRQLIQACMRFIVQWFGHRRVLGDDSFSEVRRVPAPELSIHLKLGRTQKLVGFLDLTLAKHKRLTGCRGAGSPSTGALTARMGRSASLRFVFLKCATRGKLPSRRRHRSFVRFLGPSDSAPHDPPLHNTPQHINLPLIKRRIKRRKKRGGSEYYVEMRMVRN
jgi:hypothetical protein